MLKQYIEESARVKSELVNLLPEIEKIIAALKETQSKGGRIYTCGNGGSACDAMHLAEELVARYEKERPGIAAQHLLDVGTISCWANDYNYDSVFSRQIDTLAKAEDALIVFSTSGNSKNINEAIKAAKSKGVRTIALLGKDGGEAKSLSDLCLIVPSDKTSHIQECHITIVHMLCESLEADI